MALDRQTIEKRDFPIGRRGYEPEAVDAHLARVAEEVDQLRRRASSGGGGSAKSSPASIAQAASEQVRAIVEAAEASAAAIEQNAQDEAERIREEAEADARQTRDDAVGQSQEHVGKVRQSTTQMLQRVDAMESELSGLVESLRTGANRLTADLSLLEGGMGDLYDAAGRDRPSAGPRVVESVPLAIVADEPEPEPEAEPDSEPLLAAVEDEDAPVAEEPAVAEPAEAQPKPAASVPPPASGSSADVEGARLVALNMALNGTSREDTDQYLADNFDLPDRAGLLDEVYATVES
jgi:DivIVA domain-containing protein